MGKFWKKVEVKKFLVIFVNKIYFENVQVLNAFIFSQVFKYKLKKDEKWNSEEVNI